MEGNIVNIELKGIARAGSNQSCADGLCNEVIGLEWKDGSYIPTGFGDADHKLNLILGDNQSYDRIWLHKNRQQDNFIISIYYEGQGYQYRWAKKKEDGSTYVSGEFKFLCTTINKIEKIGIVNNTIRIQDKVFLFFNGEYNELNISDIEFEMQLDVRKNGVAMLHDWCDKSVQKELADKNDTWEETWVKQNLQQLESEVKSGEYLTGMAFMRYAIKLYDGTYINLSIPVLVCDTPQRYLNGFNAVSNIKPHSLDFQTNNPSGYESVVRQMGYLVNMGWKFRNTDALEEYYENDNYRENELYERNTMVSGEVFFKEELPWNTPKSLKGAYWTENNDYIPEYYNYDYNQHEWFAFSIDEGMSLEGLSSKSLSTLGRDIRFPNKQGTIYKNPSSRVWFDKLSSSFNENWFDMDSAGAVGNNIWLSPNATYNFEVPSEYCYYGKGLGLYYDGSDFKNANKNIYQLFATRNLSTPVFKINKLPNNLSQYENLILSIDVFMTRPVSVFQDKMGLGLMSNQRRFKEVNDIKKELEDSLVAFYKILEIPYDKITEGDIKNGVIYVPYIERGRISQIEQQETLQQSYPNLDYYNISYTFNNRLHISDLTTQYLNEFVNQISSLAPSKYDSNTQSLEIIKLSDKEDSNKPSYSYKKSYTVECLYENSRIEINIPNITVEAMVRNSIDVNSIPIGSYKNHISFYIDIEGPDDGDSIFSTSKETSFSPATAGGLGHTSQITIPSNAPYVFNAKNAGTYTINIYAISQLVSPAEEYFYTDYLQVTSEDNFNYYISVKNDFIIEYLVSEITIDENGDKLITPVKIKWGNISNQIYPIIYPSDFAKSIKILGAKIIGEDGYRPFSTPIILKMKGTSNGYSWTDNIEPITMSLYENRLLPLPDFTIAQKKRNGNIFKVSSPNNLIDFPLLQTYQVSNGDIVGFASSTKALSQGQFGQFPLYVFTTEGIYAMEQTTSGTYANCHPISREVCCNPNGILQLDGQVLFTTEKGLMLLSGSDVTPFAPLLVGDVGLLPDETAQGWNAKCVYHKAITYESLVELKDSISTKDFREYVSHIDTRLNYIYNKNKVLVFNKNYKYSYIIDITTNIATKIAEKILFSDDNYPESLFAKERVGGNITHIDLHSYPYKLETGNVQTMFQTRPIKLGTYNLKSSFRVVLRGLFDVLSGKYAGLYVMGSNDAEEWMYLGGTEKMGRFRDLGTTIHRVSCKYLMVIFVGNLDVDSKINGLEISSNVKYNNKLK